MSGNQKKRGSLQPPSKRSKTGSSSGRRPSKAANFVAVEDAALCKTYVNVTLNPIDGVSSAFWDHIHRKYCVLLKEDNPSEALPQRDSESLKNRLQRKIQKKMNVYNRNYKQVKECHPSGVNTEEEIQKVAADNYRDAEGHAFAFSHCVEVLHHLPKFNLMVGDVDRSLDVAVEDLDGDKKPVEELRMPMSSREATSRQQAPTIEILCSRCSNPSNDNNR
jgi:hypothetical protein